MCCQVWQRRGLSLYAASHRPTVLAAICNTSPNVSSRRAISALLHRDRGTPSSHGRVQARAVACARTSGGKTPGRSRPSRSSMLPVYFRYLIQLDRQPLEVTHTAAESPEFALAHA